MLWSAVNYPAVIQLDPDQHERLGFSGSGDASGSGGVQNHITGFDVFDLLRSVRSVHKGSRWETDSIPEITAFTVMLHRVGHNTQPAFNQMAGKLRLNLLGQPVILLDFTEDAVLQPLGRGGANQNGGAFRIAVVIRKHISSRAIGLSRAGRPEDSDGAVGQIFPELKLVPAVPDFLLWPEQHFQPLKVEEHSVANCLAALAHPLPAPAYHGNLNVRVGHPPPEVHAVSRFSAFKHNVAS